MEDKQYKEACGLIERGCYKEAMEQLRVIIQQDEHNYAAINKLGVVYVAMQDIENAKECFKITLELNPDYAPAIVNIGNMQLESDDVHAALNYYQDAITKDSNYAMAYYNMAIAYKKLGDYSKYVNNIKKYKRCQKHEMLFKRRDIDKQKP